MSDTIEENSLSPLVIDDRNPVLRFCGSIRDYNNTVKLKNCNILLEIFSSLVRVEFSVAF
jgi:hypothetical protein